MKRKNESIASSCSSSCCCRCNDGVQWERGRLIGKGSFGSVFMASLKRSTAEFSIFPPVMAVKSAEVSVSKSLQKEKQIYDNLKGCNSLIQCFGEEITTDSNGRMIYNLLLEIAVGGSLAHRINNTGFLFQSPLSFFIICFRF